MNAFISVALLMIGLQIIVSPPFSVAIKFSNFFSPGAVNAAMMSRIIRMVPSQDRNFMVVYFKER